MTGFHGKYFEKSEKFQVEQLSPCGTDNLAGLIHALNFYLKTNLEYNASMFLVFLQGNFSEKNTPSIVFSGKLASEFRTNCGKNVQKIVVYEKNVQSYLEFFLCYATV